jgi:pyruvate carboxylase
MPGGQYTNLKEQAASMGLSHRWKEIARCYADVNLLFGDIVKVTPSSKVVGDMTMFLITRGIRPSDIVNLEPGSAPFPSSVIEMMAGSLGRPMGGWPKKVQQVILGKQKPFRGRSGASLPAISLSKIREELETKLKREILDDDVYSYLMYPQVFLEFAKFNRDYSNVSVIPTPTFFFGLKPGEEILISIEEGKNLFFKLINVGTPDKEGRRTVTFELNGVSRESSIQDRSVQSKVKSRPKVDPAKSNQLGAPIPGMITSLAVSVGSKVAKDDKLLTLEAMKMQTTIYAPADGIVDAIHAAVGDSVDSKDLLLELKN